MLEKDRYLWSKLRELVREAQGREEFHRAGEDDSLPSDQDAILPDNFMYYT